MKRLGVGTQIVQVIVGAMFTVPPNRYCKLVHVENTSAPLATQCYLRLIRGGVSYRVCHFVIDNTATTSYALQTGVGAVNLMLLPGDQLSVMGCNFDVYYEEYST